MTTDRVAVRIAALALLGSASGFALNRRAAGLAAGAAAQASRVAQESAAAATRSAGAHERSLSKAEEQEGQLARILHQNDRVAIGDAVRAELGRFVPARPVWRVERLSGGLHALENVGTAPANHVVLSSPNAVRFDGPTEPRSMSPGESVEFLAFGAFGTGTPELIVTWTEADAEPQLWRRLLP